MQVKHILDLVTLIVFGLLVLALRYTGGKGFGVISGEDEKGAAHRARCLGLIPFATTFLGIL